MKLSTVAQSLIQQAASMADQPISLSMYSDQLTEVEARIIYLEQIAQELDAYTKELGTFNFVDYWFIFPIQLEN